MLHPTFHIPKPSFQEQNKDVGLQRAPRHKISWNEGRDRETEADKDTRRRKVQDRSGKIWKPRHRAQTPATVFWSRRRRPLPNHGHSSHANKKSQWQAAARAPSMATLSMARVPDTAHGPTCSTAESSKNPRLGVRRLDAIRGSQRCHTRSLPSLGSPQRPRHIPVLSQGCP